MQWSVISDQKKQYALKGLGVIARGRAEGVALGSGRFLNFGLWIFDCGLKEHVCGFR
jgi:hypothetical protein